MTDIFLIGRAGPGTNQPGPPSLPTVPQFDGTDQGLKTTVDRLVDTVNKLTGNYHKSGNNTGGAKLKTNPSKKGPGKNTEKKAKEDKSKDKQRFTELSRNTENVTVTDPVSGASLTYQQITKLTMQDTVTGEIWEWNL